MTYSPVFVFGELGTHLEDLVVMNFLNVEAHLEALLQAVGLIFPVSNKFFICA
jgi:hypothetical protein